MKYHDGKDRCSWANPKNPIYIDYHDKEWGVPVYDDHKLFEMLILESFQAGLSWECVLNKREAFREAFDDFDVYKVSAYDEEKQAQLKENKGIIRNQRKISAAVSNATIFMKIQEQYGTFLNIYGSLQIIRSSMRRENISQNYPTRFQRI